MVNFRLVSFSVFQASLTKSLSLFRATTRLPGVKMPVVLVMALMFFRLCSMQSLGGIILLHVVTEGADEFILVVW